MSYAIQVSVPAGAASLVYYVGEQPSEPMTLLLLDPSGQPVELYNKAIDFVPADGLPAGTAAVGDPFAGTLSYSFEAPFTEAGVLTLQVRLTSETGGVDLSSPFSLTIADPADAVAVLVTPAEVEMWTGATVSDSDIARAQGVISIACGRDLNDDDFIASVSETDLYWLRIAVGYQSVTVQEVGAGAEFAPYVPGASSIANGDVRVTFKDNAVGEITLLGNLARSALSHLSWMRGFRSIQAQPFSTRGEQPTRWRTISTTSYGRYL